MVLVPGMEFFNVEVQSYGRSLPEYNDSTLDNNALIASRYIACQDDAPFEIRVWMVAPALSVDRDISITVSLDGVRSEGVLVKARTIRKMPKVPVATSSAKPISSSAEMPYRFGTIRMTESDKIVAIAKKLGCISVKVSHAQEVGMVDLQYEPVESIESISEKSLKGQSISHMVKYDRPVMKHARSGVKIHYIGDEHCVNFFYRSHEDLKKMHVIPRTPTPPPLEEREPARVTAQEVAEMQAELRRFRQQQQQPDIKPNVKREREDTSSQPRKRNQPNSQSIVLVLDDDDTFREVQRTEQPVDALDLT